MIDHWKRGCIVLVGLLCLANACQSAPKAPSQSDVFASIDTNRDGRVSSAEFSEEFFTSSFTHHDANRDKRITRMEWVAVNSEGNALVVFAEIDANGNGMLSFIEFSTHDGRTETIRHVFGTIDRNGDGFLELTELRTSS